MRDKSAALAAARAAIDNLPQYKGKQDSDPYMPQADALQQSVPPFQNQAPQQPMQNPFGQAPMDPNQFQLMKLYHLLSNLSYEMYGDPNKWQEGHVEAFFDQLRACVKKSKAIRSDRVRKMFKKR